jgi:hypothetical protein
MKASRSLTAPRYLSSGKVVVALALVVGCGWLMLERGGSAELKKPTASKPALATSAAPRDNDELAKLRREVDELRARVLRLEAQLPRTPITWGTPVPDSTRGFREPFPRIESVTPEATPGAPVRWLRMVTPEPKPTAERVGHQSTSTPPPATPKAGGKDTTPPPIRPLSREFRNEPPKE